MSLVLRHQPELIQLKMNENGWVAVEDLLNGLASKGLAINRTELFEIVATNDKKRFALNEDQTLIRASQGHSIDIDIALNPQAPPPVLYHGTVSKFIRDIQQKGLQKMARQHVHLSQDVRTAKVVGSRRGVPIILKVNTQKMHEEGYQFFLSDNGVWLVEEVPVQFIDFP